MRLHARTAVAAALRILQVQYIESGGYDTSEPRVVESASGDAEVCASAADRC